jgi:deoxyadenosine/deoxycytidine kinase
MILISGNIATGKTTLARRVAQELGYRLIEEDVEGNDFISKFYSDMPRWALHSQLYFLLARAEEMQKATERGENFVIDRSPSEDVNVFSKNLLRAGVLSPAEYDLIRRVYATIRYLEDKIKICVYLYDDSEKILSRVRHRANQYENGITEDYIERTNTLYTEWRDSEFFRDPIDIKTSEIDFRTGNDGFKAILERVSRVL